MARDARPSALGVPRLLTPVSDVDDDSDDGTLVAAIALVLEATGRCGLPLLPTLTNENFPLAGLLGAVVAAPRRSWGCCRCSW